MFNPECDACSIYCSCFTCIKFYFNVEDSDYCPIGNSCEECRHENPVNMCLYFERLDVEDTISRG